MSEILGGNLNANRTHGLRRKRIYGECMLRVDGLEAGCEKGPRGELEDVVRTVPSTSLIHANAKTPQQRFLQLEAVAVRITGDIGERRLHRLHRKRTNTKRILV